jgi:hypothetical protein
MRERAFDACEELRRLPSATRASGRRAPRRGPSAGRAGGARRGEQGTALTEAAIITPVLILLLYWSSAITDFMVLKVKGEEAARFAVWETTAFRDGTSIANDIAARFSDLRSPASETKNYTGLLLYQKATDLRWTAAVNTAAAKKGIGGTISPPPVPSWWQSFWNIVIGLLSSAVDTAITNQKFNVYGYAEATVTLGATQSGQKIILGGGDLVGAKGGNDLGTPAGLANLTLRTPMASERPMRLVFDTWKAWPKPAAYTFDGAPTNITETPANTYPAVEKQVAYQVDKIAFFGLNRQSWFTTITGALGWVFNNSVSRTLLGGQLPTINATGQTDGNRNGSRPLDWGPITIRPVDNPVDRWAPGGGLNTNRLGDEGTTTLNPVVAQDLYELTDGVDRSRYTVPYQINSQYWGKGTWGLNGDGGTDSGNQTSAYLTALPPAIAKNNQYVASWKCRGHYFLGSQKAQATTLTNRYATSCASR